MSGDRAVDTLSASELETLARAIVDDGLATRELSVALDQLVADRANGEPLDAAADDLRAVLAQGDHRPTVWSPPRPGTEPS